MKKLIILLFMLLFIPVNVFAYSDESSVKIEFEDGELTGSNTVIKELSTASTGKYVKSSDNDSTITIKYNSEKGGFYNLTISTAHSSSKNKVQMLFINDEYQGDYTFNPNSTNSSTNFQEVDLGVIKLKAGENTIAIRPKFGYQSYDYLLVTPIDDIEVSSSTKNLLDSNATFEAVCLFNYLNSIYGKYTLAGQQEMTGASREDEFNYIKENTGKLPAIRGFDLGAYINPMYSQDYGTIDRIKDWVLNKGGIAAISVDVRIPKDITAWGEGTLTGYSNATTKLSESNFKISNVFVDNTYEKKFIDEVISNLANELKKLQDAKVPAILRLLQESEGSGGLDGSSAWFWYGGEGNETYIKLYRYFVDELKNHYNIHNIIYVSTVYSTPNNSELWYPGNDYVDIVGYDRYTSNISSPEYSSASSTYFNLINTYNNKKMITMAENDSVISPLSMKDQNSRWLYFLTWYSDYLFSSEHNTLEQLKETYNDESVLTLDELDDYKKTCSKKEEVPNVEVEHAKEEVVTNEYENPDTGTFFDIAIITIIFLVATITIIIFKKQNKFYEV